MWSELYRRRVTHVFAAWVIFCFVAINALLLAAELAQWPGWVAVLTMWCAAASMPIVAAIAWKYDFTPHGIEETAEQGDIKRWPLGLLDKRVEGIIIALLFILLGIGFHAAYLDVKESGPQAIETPTE